MFAAVLLDIEGTTSSIAFVADVLFPYARERLPSYVADHAADVAPILADVPGDDKVATLLQWIAEDRKATPLKELQGRIWAQGYADGALKGHVYPDTPQAMRRWKDACLAIHIYSSGSEQAQRLIFGHSVAGDLTPMIDGYFDTRVGGKREPKSYTAIADRLSLDPAAIVFVSDVAEEVAAARTAGLAAMLIDRDGAGGDISTLAEVLP